MSMFMRAGALALLAASVAAGPAFAKANADDAKALSEKAAAFIKQVGEEKAFDTFTKGEDGFKKEELYVFCYAPDGTNLAHGANAAFVGKNLLHVKDPDGKEANAEIIKTGMGAGQGWVDFKWPNPTTKKIEEKSAYVIKTNNEVCGVGYYK
jgi:cytochrome c